MKEIDYGELYEQNEKAWSDWDAIGVMCGSEGWAALTQALNKKRKLLQQVVAEELDDRKLRQAQGRLQEIRWFLTLPDLAKKGKVTTRQQMKLAEQRLGRNGTSSAQT